MKKWLFSFFIFIIIIEIPAFAQGNFNVYLQQGKNFYSKSEYFSALERFDLAYEFAKNNNEKGEARIWKNKSRKKIKFLQRELKNALIEAEKKKRDAIEANEKAQKIINAFYFYDNKFALAYNGARYGFIDKLGNIKIPYYYQDASPFKMQTGFASVTRENINYLIDTSCTEYMLAEDVDKLSSAVFAIDLSNQEKNEIDSEIFNYQQVKILILHTNQIRKVGPDIKKLSNVFFIDLRWNDLRSLPAEIGSLGKLEKLILYSNELTALPKELGNLQNLKVLNVWRNKLIEIPREIGNLKQLKLLDVGNNEIRYIPSEIGNLTELEILQLNSNQFRDLPNNIVKLRNLKLLDLGWNNLTEIPPEIYKLVKLEKLSLEKNQITSLPLEIGDLVNLKQLRLDYNKISKLPTEIAKLINLQDLRLAKNPIKSLPTEISKLKNLKTLDLHGCLLSNNEKERVKKLLPNCEIEF